MPIILFLIDTSASMNQRTCLGTTLLDIAKGAVETFVKLRQRDPASRTDRYMLMTFDEPPGGVKAGWRENFATFMTELKNLQADGTSTLGATLKGGFDLINLYRLQSGIDNYGMGRNPFYLDPALVICITDGDKLTTAEGVHEELHLPMHANLAGSELTKEPFRWDERLFALLLRLPGTPGTLLDKNSLPAHSVQSDAGITAMCEVTGGRSYTVTSPKTLAQALESLVQKVHYGVVIHFEKIGGPDEKVKHEKDSRDCVSPSGTIEYDVKKHIPNGFYDNSNQENISSVKTEGQGSSGPVPSGVSPRGEEVASALPNHVLSEMTNGPSSGSRPHSPVPAPASNMMWYNCRRLIYVRTNPKTNMPQGHWPIPESFWPDPSAQTLDQRDAHPTVLFSCNNAEPMILENLPFDKYELEPSPLTQYILEKKNPNVCWQTYMRSSSRNGDIGEAFGYLKASVTFTCVNLFVMPYNYSTLLPLLDELFKVHKLKPNGKWLQNFDNYLATMPSYYGVPLRTALRKMGAPPGLVPDHIDGSLSFSIVNYLKKVKQQAKIDADRFVSLIGKKSESKSSKSVSSYVNLKTQSAKRTDYRQVLSSGSPVQGNSKLNAGTGDYDNVVPSLVSQEPKESIKTQCYKNPFDVSRTSLLPQLNRMKINFFQTSAVAPRLQDQDSVHSISIAQMGNYQDHLKQLSPLRDVDPGQSRVHMFGNPFKLAKDQKMMVDEADINEAMTGPGSPGRKRVGERPLSPRDKRRRLDLSPQNKRSPSPMMSPASPPLSPQPQPVNKPAVKKGSPGTVKKTESSPNRKRKGDGEKTDEKEPPSKSARPSINPQLKKLQQLHQAKDRKKVVNSVMSGQVKAAQAQVNNRTEEIVEDISSILRRACSGSDQDNQGNAVDPEVVGSRTDSELQLQNFELGDKRTKPKGLTFKQFQKIQEENCELKREMIREVRMPGSDNRLVLSHMERLRGSVKLKMAVISEVMEEANAFKNKALVERIQSLVLSDKPEMNCSKPLPEKLNNANHVDSVKR